MVVRVGDVGEGAAPSGASAGFDAWLDRVACRRAAESLLREVFLERGFREVALPAVEEAEVLPGGGAEDGQGHPYRFLDQEGRVWALRVDVTPGLARLLHARDREGRRPRRLFYVAEVYRRLADRRGPVGMVQVGAEVVGGRGPGEDAGLLSLAAAVLRTLGLDEFQLAVGHVGVLREILAGAGLTGTAGEQVLAALQARNYVRARDVLAAHLDPGTAAEVAGLITWRGSPARFLGLRCAAPEAGGAASPAGAGGAAWADLHAILGACRATDNVWVDLGLVRDRNYYTGMVFEISLPGLSQPVGGGGRYDGVLTPEPATGFAFDLGAVLAVAPLGPGGGGCRARGAGAALAERLQVVGIH